MHIKTRRFNHSKVEYQFCNMCKEGFIKYVKLHLWVCREYISEYNIHITLEAWNMWNYCPKDNYSIRLLSWVSNYMQRKGFSHNPCQESNIYLITPKIYCISKTAKYKLIWKTNSHRTDAINIHHSQHGCWHSFSNTRLSKNWCSNINVR